MALQIVKGKVADAKTSATHDMFMALRNAQEFSKQSKKYLSIKNPTAAQKKKLNDQKRRVWVDIDRAVTQAEKVLGLK